MDESTSKQTAFLTAEWHDLLMLNYELEAEILRPFLPDGVGLDLFEGRALVSLVGFRFLKTRLLGLMIPFHTNFDELNLRFYVIRHMADGSVRRGVVFVREVVPRWAIATTARVIYNEPYISLPMRHVLALDSADQKVAYNFRYSGSWYSLSGEASGDPILATSSAETAFITEHYWGYTRQRSGRTAEYRVSHPVWNIRSVSGGLFEGDAGRFYGSEFGAVLSRAPVSGFLADGSEVAVYPGKMIN